MRRALRLAAVIALVVAFTPVAAANAAAPLANGALLDTQVWPGGEMGQTVVICSVNLPQGTKLPATVRIPIPDGGEAVWVGEIVGANVNTDPQRAFLTKQGTGGKYIEFEMSQSLQGQVELVGWPLTAESGRIKTAVTWVQSVPSSGTAFSARVPAGVTKVEVDPRPTDDPEKNLDGEALYPLPALQMKPGEKQEISVSYAAQTTADPAGPFADQPLMPWLLGALGVAVLALLAVLAVGRSRRPVGDEEQTLEQFEDE